MSAEKTTEPLAVYRLRAGEAAKRREAGQLVLVACAALATGACVLFGYWRLAALFAGTTAAVVWLRSRHPSRLVEDQGELALFADRVEVSGLPSGPSTFALETLAVRFETLRVVAGVAQAEGSRALVLEADGQRCALLLAFFEHPSSAARILRDLEQIRRGDPPAGPSAPVREATRDAEDRRVDDELSRLPDED